MKLIFRWTNLYRLVVLALAYALLAKIALGLFTTTGSVSTIWPASGLAVAALLLGGKKYWPGVFIGALAGNIMQGSSVGISIFIASGNTLEALACLWLLARAHRFNSALNHLRDYMWLITAAAISACVSALIGVISLWLAGSLAPQVIAVNLLHWWQGDVLGIVLVTPLTLVWRQLPYDWFNRERVVEAVACFGLAFLFGQAVFLSWFHDSFGHVIKDDWMFMFILWSALRFGRHGALLVITMTVVQALLGAAQGVGVFAMDPVQTNLFYFWLYMLSISLIGMALALSITERNLTADILRVSEERLKIAADSGQVGIWDYNLQTKELVWDDNMFVLYGARREDFSGAYDAWSTRLHPEDRAATEAKLQDSIAGIRAYESEFRVIWPDGDVHYIKGHAQVIKDQAGNPVRIIGTNWDNREHAHAQQQLQLAHTAIEKSRSTFYRLSSTGVVQYANNYACESLGYTQDELIGMHVWEFASDLSLETWTPMWERLRRAKVSSIETHYRRKDGTIFSVEMVSNIIYSENEEYGFVFVQDITERKQAETVLIDSQQRLRFLNDLGNATHSLHEPKDIIATVARLLGSHLGASRCAYAEMDADGDGFTIPYDYTEGCTSIVGDYQLSLFGSRAVSELHAGRTLMIGDVDADLSPDEGRDMFNAIEIKAVICCPMIRQGMLRAMMAVHQTTARKWTPYEVSLVEEVVERCWAIIERARAEKERKRAEAIAKDRGQRLLTIIETEPECVKVVDAKGNLLEMNAAGLAMLEAASLEEAQQHSLMEYILSDHQDAFRKLQKRVMGGKSGTLKFEVLGLKGTRRWLETHAAPMRNEVGKVTSLLGVTRDITEQKRSEQRIQSLSHLYQALSQVNQAIVRMDQQSELFPLVCRCAVEFGGMKMAWIGQLDKTSGIITPVASYGDSTGYLDNIHISSHADVAEGRGPTGTAYRENRSVIINDYLSDPMTAPWHAQAVKFGWGSGASFPIQRDGRSFAVLSVYHDEINAFNEESVSLLKEMSVDISFALDNFDHETQRKAAEESLRLAASVYDTSTEGIIITDADNRIITVNPAFVTITGYPKEEVIGKHPRLFSSSQHGEAFYEAMWQSINTSGYWQGEIWNKRKNGEIFPKWVTISTIFSEDGTVQRRVIMFTDISQKKEAEQLIWRQANFDFLTTLPNRQMFYDRLDQEIKKAHRAGRPLALMFIDLDRFKEINDTLGHDKGDTLLKEAAHRFSSCVRETDTVARLGGDEFTVILSELDDSGNVERVAQNILHKLAEPFYLGDEVAYISASIGITFYPEDATGIETLLKNADQAMYAAKDLGRNRYSYFTPSMQLVAHSRMQISNDLRSALTNHQFWIAYQPIVELATGSIHKAEALIRWQHPTRGLVSPAEFIPIAEDTELIIDIGDWVFREAAQQVKRWRALLHPTFQISVNKSPVQFHNESQSHLIWYDHLRQLGLPGQSIAVEITEGMLLEASNQVTDRLLEFHNAGIQISLDDFGTGYSALSYLKKFDIDYLKIDQSFTRNLASGSDDMALCEAIIVLSHKLNMKVIAEGVETLEQRDLLIAAGCDYGQGYFFSRPIPANEFEVLMKKA